MDEIMKKLKELEQRIETLEHKPIKDNLRDLPPELLGRHFNPVKLAIHIESLRKGKGDIYPDEFISDCIVNPEDVKSACSGR